MLSGCTTIVGIDAQITNFLLGTGYAPKECTPGPHVPYKIVYASVPEISKACGVPSFECVVRAARNPEVTVYLTPPEETPKYLQEFQLQHALCHVHRAHEYNDFSHRVFQRFPPQD